MTIVSGPDKRNSQWAADKSAFGQRMLMKMGWSEGKGLGKNQQGTNTNLRAIRREEGLGIGAKTDIFGDDGFSKTSKNFHGVLANLHQEHTKNSIGSNGKKSKKDKKKDKKSKSKSSESSGTLTLSSKRVTAGHARKMRESKDLGKKSKEDMAAIFGMKVEEYQKNSVWGRLSSLSTTNSANNSSDEEKKNEENDNVGNDSQTSDINSENKKRRKDKKKRKRKKEDDASEEIESENKKKRKKSKKKSSE